MYEDIEITALDLNAHNFLLCRRQSDVGWQSGFSAWSGPFWLPPSRADYAARQLKRSLSSHFVTAVAVTACVFSLRSISRQAEIAVLH